MEDPSVGSRVLPARLQVGKTASPRAGEGKDALPDPWPALPPHLRARAATVLNFESFREGKDKASLSRAALKPLEFLPVQPLLFLSDVERAAAIVLPFHRASKKRLRFAQGHTIQILAGNPTRTACGQAVEVGL